MPPKNLADQQVQVFQGRWHPQICLSLAKYVQKPAKVDWSLDSISSHSNGDRYKSLLPGDDNLFHNPSVAAHIQAVSIIVRDVVECEVSTCKLSEKKMFV